MRIPGPAAIRQKIKERNSLPARIAYDLGMGLRSSSLPVIPGVHSTLYHITSALSATLSTILRVAWYTPLFQSRLTRPVRKIFVYNGMPLVTGPTEITLGERCRIAGGIIINGRTTSHITPQLTVGDNVDLGWGCNIAVGRRIDIGHNVRLAAGVLLLGYPGHPIDAAARARGDMDSDDQIGDIILEDDVWLASRVIVMAGVRIGRGTIVAAGSVVTKDLPSNVLAAGVPAVVKKKLDET